MLRQSLALGFRIFFLLASAHAAVGMAVWLLLLSGLWAAPEASLPLVAWHAHEMVFGFARAVVAGFLLTAVRNWTGHATPTGTPLGLLALAWVIPRVLGLSGGWALAATAVFDVAFGWALFIAVLVPVVRARQARQVEVLSWLALLAVAECVFYAGAAGWASNGTQVAVKLGVYAILGLLLTLAARVVPFFVRSALPDARPFASPLWEGRVLSACLVVLAAADALSWPDPLRQGAAAVLFVGHGRRLVAWWRPGVSGRSLLWVLYGAYAWIVVGFALQALGAWVGAPPVVALHAHAVGGVGAMAAGMMVRVSLGHTGRDVRAPRPWLGVLFFGIFLATLARVSGPWVMPGSALTWYQVAATVWVACFSALTVWGFPLWTRPRPDGEPG